MSTVTEYFNLKKPDRTDKYNINVFNDNVDLIDAELHRIDSKELTKENVTNALGYIPYTPNEVDNKLSTLETKIDWKEAVETFDDIATTYPDPQDGWTVNTKNTDYTYRFDGEKWVVISANAIPKATDNVDGLLSKEDHIKYEDTNDKKHTHDNKSVLDGVTSTLIATWNTVSNKIDKVVGKGLSSNDYTNTEKEKLDGIESGAQKNDEFLLINQQILAFTNNICTIDDTRITSDSLADVYFTTDTIEIAESADISVETYSGNVKLTAENSPTGTIKASIRIRVV